jgi:hypothetical protein
MSCCIPAHCGDASRWTRWTPGGHATGKESEGEVWRWGAEELDVYGVHTIERVRSIRLGHFQVDRKSLKLLWGGSYARAPMLTYVASHLPAQEYLSATVTRHMEIAAEQKH